MQLHGPPLPSFTRAPSSLLTLWGMLHLWSLSSGCSLRLVYSFPMYLQFAPLPSSGHCLNAPLWGHPCMPYSVLFFSQALVTITQTHLIIMSVSPPPTQTYKLHIGRAIIFLVHCASSGPRILLAFVDISVDTYRKENESVIKRIVFCDLSDVTKTMKLNPGPGVPVTRVTYQ